MPVKWEIQDPLLILRFEDDYRAEELIRALVEAIGSPAFRPGLFVLGDGRRSNATISASDADWRVEWVSSLPKLGFSSRCAVVVNNEAHRLGVARKLSIRLGLIGVRLGIFHDTDEAIEWLTGESLPTEAQ
jgi:hypothetical protein